MTTRLRRPIARGITLALMLLFAACAYNAASNRKGYTEVVMRNHAWQDATVDIYCGDGKVKRLYVTAVKDKQDWLYLERCTSVWAHVRLFGLDRKGVATDRVKIYPNQELQVVIPNNRLKYAFIAVFPQR